MQLLTIVPEKTALVIIDLQKGITAMAGKPNDCTTVIKNSAALAEAFRAAGSFVVLVNVNFFDGKDVLQPAVDAAPPAVSRPDDWAEIVADLNQQPSDYLITKRQWGAFYGTDLDLQLRRRGIDTIVLCGISTSIGVDTTAREAFQHNYNQIFAVDAMTAFSVEEHEYTCNVIFPRIGRVRTTEEIIRSFK
jgi:nicotinamidase-related amidase